MAQSIPMYGLNSNGGARKTPPYGTPWRKVAARNGSGNGSSDVAAHPSHANSGAEAAAAAVNKDKETAAEIQALAGEVRRAQAGDAQAMCGLIDNNRAWVRGIAYAVLGDAHLAEDAAQDVCVRMVKHLRGLDTPEAFRPWVYRMTRNVALSMAQRRERAPQPLGLDAEQMGSGGVQAAREEPPGAALEAEERFNVVLETIHRLPHIYREVLVLKHVQDLSYAEMSAILGVNIKSLEVRLVRARKLLQVRLGRRFERRRKRDPGGEGLALRGELPDKGRALAAPGECQASQLLMSKCVDSELKADEAAALKEHLLDCGACQSQLKQWKEQSALMSKALDAVWKRDGAQVWSVLPRTRKE